MQPGLVSTASWTDFDNDGKLDLIMAGEWMPISVFKNSGEELVSVTNTIGLDDTEGWWFSMASGDFDKDGDIDFVFGNLGLNYKYQASQEKTFDIYFDDFDNNKTGDIVLSYNENGKDILLRGRECSSRQMPFIREKFGTYDAFANASMQDVFGEEKLTKALHLQARTFTSVYVENTGDNRWNIRPLPRMAQLSSVNGIVINDIDKDGNLDVILAGNLFASEVETPRNDAGNGLVLKGDGVGGFSPLTFSETGLFIPNDRKQLHGIMIDNECHVVAVNNSDALHFFKLLNSN